MICIARIFGAPETVPGGKARHQRVEMIVLCRPACLRPSTPGASRASSARAPMYCGTRTLPYSQTRPTSFRPRSTSMTCSARSFSFRFSSSASRRSSSSVAAARPGAGDRVGLDVLPLDADQHLGRRPDDREAAHADEIHVGRRIDVPQRAIDGERLATRRPPRTAATAPPGRCRRPRCAP